LIDRPIDEIDTDRIEAARAFATEHGVVLVLKGRPTAIGTPDSEVYLNPTGNTGLATGGSGDVLTGLVSGFLAGGASPADAAVWTMLFSRMLLLRKSLKSAMETTAAGIEAQTVMPANNPRYALAAASTTESTTPNVTAFIVISGIG